MCIACPKCDWRPDADDVWGCTCGYVWNTFETHGVCPACGKAWKVTQCSSAQGCGQWSDHEDDDLTVEEFLANPQRLLMPRE